MTPEYTPLQFFGQKKPALDDALEALRLAVALLENALPLALRHVGGEPLEVQAWFWYAFQQFEDANDLMMDGWNLAQMTERLSEFGEHIATLLLHSEDKS